MQKTAFDELTVLCRTQESRAGCAEVCQDASGAKTVRVRIRHPDIQKEVLAQLRECFPACLSDGVLDLLLPWREGKTLAEWLYTAKPSLGQRRDACLSLLADLIALSAAPGLIALSAATENLCFTAQHCHLQLLPDLTIWHPGIGAAQMVGSVARLMQEILVAGQSAGDRYRFPAEMQLILRRCDLGAYVGWDLLQQDLAALPDDLRPVDWFLRQARARLYRIVNRYIPVVIRILVAVLAVAALLSLVSAYRTQRSEQKNTWPGMAVVGDQVLHGEEGEGT